jgi:hypothetical protein
MRGDCIVLCIIASASKVQGAVLKGADPLGLWYEGLGK